MNNYLNLLDDAKVTGNDAEELKAVLEDKDTRSAFVPVSNKDISFLVLSDVAGEKPVGMVIPPVTAGNAAYGAKVEKNYTLQEVAVKDFPLELGQEVVESGVFMNVPGYSMPVPMSVKAVEDLMEMVGLRGTATEYRTPTMMEYLYTLLENRQHKVVLNADGTADIDEIGNTQTRAYKKKGVVPKDFDITLSMVRDREDPSLVKIFACRTGKYKRIEQQSVMDIINSATMLGRGQLQMLSWEVTHNLTEAYAGFPELSNEFSSEFQLKFPVMPAFRICTSDTGNSSLRIEKCLMLTNSNERVYLRIPEAPGERSSVLTRHTGADMANRVGALVQKMNRDLYKSFREFPEKLAEIATLGRGDTVATLRAAFEAMELQRKGVVIDRDLQEELVKELSKDVDPCQDIFTTVYSVLFCADNPNMPLTEYQRAELRRNALKAVYGDFTKAANTASYIAS